MPSKLTATESFSGRWACLGRVLPKFLGSGGGGDEPSKRGPRFAYENPTSASLASNAEVTIYPWKDSQEHIDQVVEHAQCFLKVHEPVRA